MKGWGVWGIAYGHVFKRNALDGIFCHLDVRFVFAEGINDRAFAAILLFD